MGKRLTLFELHTYGDIQIGPESIGPAIEGTEPTTPEQSVEDDDGGLGLPTKGIVVFVVLAVLVVLAVAAKVLVNGLDEEPVELAESDDL